MILVAMISLATSVRSDSRSAARAISNAMPITRLVSGSNRWLSRYGVIGMLCPAGALPVKETRDLFYSFWPRCHYRAGARGVGRSKRAAGRPRRSAAGCSIAGFGADMRLHAARRDERRGGNAGLYGIDWFNQKPRAAFDHIGGTLVEAG